jgi:hypothetical protein
MTAIPLRSGRREIPRLSPPNNLLATVLLATGLLTTRLPDVPG